MKNAKRILAYVLCLVMVFGLISCASPKATTYKVSGTFEINQSEDGSPVATVKLVAEDGKTYLATVAESGVVGTYTVEVPSGVYRVVIEKDGYLTYTVQEVSVTDKAVTVPSMTLTANDATTTPDDDTTTTTPDDEGSSTTTEDSSDWDYTTGDSEDTTTEGFEETTRPFETTTTVNEDGGSTTVTTTTESVSTTTTRPTTTTETTTTTTTAPTTSSQSGSSSTTTVTATSTTQSTTSSSTTTETTTSTTGSTTPTIPPVQTLLPLQNSLMKLKNEKELNVAYFGGSNTVGTKNASNGANVTNPWRVQTNHYLQTTYNATINDLSIRNTGSDYTNRLYVGGYGSYQGLTQLEQFLSATRKPDLVFIEYAINDNLFYTTEDETSRYMESIVRRLYTINPSVDIVFVLLTSLDDQGTGSWNSTKAMKKLAEHYNLVVADGGAAMKAYVDGGTATWATYFPDATDKVHPVQEGYDVYAEEVQKQLAAGFEAAKNANSTGSHVVPAPKNQNYIKTAELIHPQDVIDANPNAGLTKQAGNYGTPNGVLELAPGQSFEITFTGTSLGMWMKSPGALQYELDTAPVSPTLKAGTAWKSVPQLFFDNLEDKEHTLKVTNPATNNDKAEIAEIVVGKASVKANDSLSDVSLKDKNVVAIGDSLTEGDYGSDPAGTMNVKEKGYPYFFAAATGATVNNQGHCGATPLSYWQNYKNSLNVTDADVILIMLGTNNAFWDANPLSKATLDADTAAADYNNYADTQLGRYASLIEYCQDKSDALIILMTPPTSSQKAASTFERIATGVNLLADKYSLPVIDNYNNCGITLQNINTYMPIDGLHCGEEGYKLLGEYIATETDKLYRNLVSQPYMLDYEEINGAEYGFNGRWFDKTVDTVACKATFTAGSEFYFKVTGTTSVQLSLKSDNGLPASLAVSINGRTPVRYLPADLKGNLFLVNGLDKNATYIFRIIVDGLREYADDKWNQQVSFNFEKAIVDNGGVITGLKPKNKKILYFGDSITEGVLAMGNTTLGSTPAGNSAIGTYHFTASHLLNAVSFPAGYGATGITVSGNGNVPKCSTVIDNLYKDTAMVYPDISEIGAIVINHGTNDGSGSADRGFVSTEDFILQYEGVLKQLSDKFPNVPILAVAPFGGSNAANINTAVTNFKTNNPTLAGNVHYIDVGRNAQGAFELTDALHPTSKGGKDLGTRLANAIEQTLGGEWKVTNKQ